MVNIFVSSKCPIKSARALPDLLTARMCLESAQILCGAILNVAYGDSKSPSPLPKFIKVNWYKVKSPPYVRSLGQRKHPSILWASKDRRHFEWVLEHMKALNDEYKLRYSKTIDVLAYLKCYDYLKEHAYLIPKKSNYEIEFIATITHANLLKDHWSVHRKYRVALVHKYLYLYDREPTWKNCEPPQFLSNPNIIRYLRRVAGKPKRTLCI